MRARHFGLTLTSHTLMGETEMNSWPLQQAKARFREFLEAALKKGPQVVTRRGVEEAVFVPIEEWRRLQRVRQPNIKEWLLGEGPRFEDIVRKRVGWKIRPAIDFSESEAAESEAM